jgi:hypothetical protein
MRVEWGKQDREGFIYARGVEGCFASVAGDSPRKIQNNLRRLGLRVVEWKYSSFGAKSELSRIKAT